VVSGPELGWPRRSDLWALRCSSWTSLRTSAIGFAQLKIASIGRASSEIRIGPSAGRHERLQGKRMLKGVNWMARTFGARFVEEFQRSGGSTTAWPPAAIEALKNADRRTFIDALGKVSSASAKTLVIAAHTAEPETLGRRAAVLMQADAASDTLWPLLLASLLAG
jgi:hypothetical protein